MSDGRIVIDVELDDSQVRSDSRTIEQLLQNIGSNAGNHMQSNFNHNAQQVKHDAQQAANDVHSQFNRPVNINLHLNGSQVQHEADNALGHIKTEVGEVEKKFEGLKAVFEGTFLANAAESGIEAVKEGISKLIETGIEYNATQDQMKATWLTLTGSASKGNEMVDMVNKFQKATGYSTEMLNEMEQKIYHIKGSASETNTMTKAFTTLGDAMGLSNDKLLGVSEQFSQMMATGKAYAGDLNIMTNAFPAFGDNLQKYMGMGMGQIRKMASQGKLSAQDVENTLIAMSHKYSDATKNQMNTTQGLWRSMQSNFARLAGAFTKPIFSMKKSGFKDLADWLSSDQASQQFTKLGESVAKFFGKVVDVIDYLAKHKDELLGFAGAALKVAGAFAAFSIISKSITAITEVIKGIKEVTTALTEAESVGAVVAALGGPITLIALGIIAVGLAFYEAYKHCKPFHDAVNDIVSVVKKDFVNGFDAAVQAIDKIKARVSAFVDGIKDIWKGDKTSGNNILSFLGLDSYEIKEVDKAVGKVKGYFSDFEKSMTEVWDTVSKSVKKGIDYVGGYITKGLDAVKKYWNSVFPDLQPALDNLWKIVKKVVEIDMLPLWLILKASLAALKASWKDIWNAICDAVKLVFDAIVGVVKVGWDVLSGIFKVIIDLLSGHFSKAWKDMKSTVVKTMEDLFGSLKKITGDIGKLFVDLGKGIANGLLAGLSVGVNAVSGGINWILDKVHAPKGDRIPKWKPPHYAQGTDGHPGGLAVVGDGKKRELIQFPDGRSMLSPNNDTLVNLPRGTNVLDGNTTEKLLNMGIIPQYANGIGTAWDWLKTKASGAWSNLSSIGKNIWTDISDPSKLIQNVVKQFTKLGGMLNPALGMAQGAVTTGANDAVSWIKSLVNFNTAPNGSVSGNVTQWLKQAMMITNTPANFLGGLSTIAMHESGGNPHAINNWDINAIEGHPSEGLMQVIGPTFAQYGISSLGDIWNPVANAVAAIRYMKSRYGSISSVPGVSSLSHGGPYVGYANGTGGSVGGNVVVGEEGPELIQTTDGRTVLATQPTSFNDFMAGTKVTPLANSVMAKAKSVLNKVGNPSLSTPLVKAHIANANGAMNIQVDVQPIVVETVLDGQVIAKTVTDIQNQNSTRTSRLRGQV